jgi:hypothetical protein
MQARLLEQIPRFGWTKKVLIDSVLLGDGAGVNPTVTAAVERPPGMFQAAVLLTLPGSGSTGTGQIGAILEGSNTGDESNPFEWFQIAALSLGSVLFSPAGVLGQQQLMGGAQPFVFGTLNYSGSSGNVNLGRFGHMRVRMELKLGTLDVVTYPLASAPTITISGIDLVPAGGARTPGADDYDDTAGSAAAVAADIEAAINDPLNSFVDGAGVGATVSGTVVTVEPLVGDPGRTGFTMTSSNPADIDYGPLFDDLIVRMTGIQGDGETFVKNLNIRSESGESNNQTSDFIERPAGTRYLTTTAKLVEAVWDPPAADGYFVRLEGAIDRESADAGTFIFMGIEFIEAIPPASPPPLDGQAVLFNPTGGLVIDMGPFNFFRYSVQPISGGTPPTDLSSYTITCSAAFDDNDWLNGEQGLTELSSALQAQFIQLKWGAPGDQIGDTITVPAQLVDFNGVPLTLGKNSRVFIIASESQQGKFNDPHPTATLTSPFRVGIATGTNRITINTADGTFSVVVDSNGVAGDVYISADPYVDDPPAQTLFPYSLVASEILKLTFV